ncbi:hypothetical protein ACWGS9_28670 [Bradyrhizobium sp. Arg314]
MVKFSKAKIVEEGKAQQRNEERLERNGYVCDIHQKRPQGARTLEATSHNG